MVSVILRENETIDRALKRLKKATDRENITQELRKREFFEKPSAIKNRKNREIKRKLLSDRKKANPKK